MYNNQDFIVFTKNPTNYDQSKNINMQHHFIKEKIKTKVVECHNLC